MAIYIQTPNGLYPIGGQTTSGKVTKSKIIEALGYTPSAFDGDYNSLNNKPDIIEDGSDNFYIVDSQGNIIFKVDSDGIHSVNLTIGDKTINEIIQESAPSGNYSGDYNDLKNKPEIIEDGSDELSIIDTQGNIIFKVDSNGIHSVNLTLDGKTITQVIQESIPDVGDGTSGEDGREVDLQVSSTHIQWQYVGDSTWTDIISLADLKGPAGSDGGPGADGVDGKSVELRVNNGNIEWCQVGGSWISLISLEELANQTPRDYNDLENKPEILEDESAELSIVDSQGNIIAKITSEGIQAVNFLVGETKDKVALEKDLEEVNNTLSEILARLAALEAQ